MPTFGHAPIIDAIDLFAGPGGWSTAAALLGIQEIGVEWNADACATARAAGHVRIQADIALLDPRSFYRPQGLIASPPCPTFSAAGKGSGKRDLPVILAAIADVGSGAKTADEALADLREKVEDLRSALVLEPLRWVLDLEPRWTTWEQVPAVLPLWEACAEVLRAAGYAVWTGNVTAEQFGVPQTRKRAILIATRDGRADAELAPVPTHRKYRKSVSQAEWLPGQEELLPWVSMRDALSWGMTERPYVTVASGTAAGGTDPQVLGGSGARKTVADELASGRWVQRSNYSAGGKPGMTAEERGRTERDSARRELDEPAFTITSAQDGGSHRLRWEPANEGSIRVTVAEAAVLQSFPADYPWQGTKTAHYRQVGDAVPPGLAEAILRTALGSSLDTHPRMD